MYNLLAGIGITEGEEKVYVALLKLGSSSTGAIAKEAGVSRSKLYEILEKLSRKGLVSHYLKNGVAVFSAARPSRIVDFIDKKEQDLEQSKSEFMRNLPFYEGLIGKKEVEKEAEVFEGMEGIKSVREQALQTMKHGETMYFFGNSATSHEHVIAYWDDWNKRRVARRITAKIIYNQDAVSFGERRKKLECTSVRYLHKPGLTPAWIEIYGDIVAIAIKYKTPMSVVINNPYVAQSFRTYFELLWDVALKAVPRAKVRPPAGVLIQSLTSR